MSEKPMPMSADDTLAAIIQTSKQISDRFIIRVGKRKGVSGMFEQYGGFADASAAHIASPEGWISQVFGGGEYQLAVCHNDTPAQQIGSKLVLQIGGITKAAPDRYVTSQPGWLGPPTVTFLAGGMAPIGDHVVMGGAPIFTSQANAPVTSQQQGGVPFTPDPLASERDRLARLERDLTERQARQLREQQEREEAIRRLESENKMREEIANRERALTAQMMEIKSAIAAAPAKPTGPSIAEIIAAAAPIVTMFVQSSRDSQLALAKMQSEAQERAERRAEEQARLTREMIEKVTSKPGMTPEMQMLIETLRAQGSGSSEMLGRIVDVMTVVNKSSVGMIEAIADLKLGGEEPQSPLLMAAREAINALKAMSSAGGGAARRVALPPQPQARLPNYNQAATAPAPSNGAPQGPVPAGATATAPQVPAPVPAAFDGMDPAAVHQSALKLGKPSPDDDPIVVLEHAIRAHYPIESVAAYFFEALPLPKMQAAIRASGGDPNTLLVGRLGFWLTDPTNLAYVEKLGALVDKVGRESGVFVEDPATVATAAAAEEEEGDDEGEEEETEEELEAQSAPAPATQIVEPRK